MKNLTKLFITVVAGMLAFSCVTDITEDQAVQLGSGQTTLSISLDGTRTHLGENTGDGYPLYWSAGDKVAVNGYTSAEIASQYVGTSGAEFTFNTSELGDTYNLVYPAPAEDVTASATAGQYPVVFPASQSYNAANPAEVAAPMYGYAPAGETMTLQHLSGVLRFLIKGNGEVLESIEVRSESGKIAGIFDVNCADGTLTPREDAGNTVTVSFGEGLTLGEEATIVHVAVPSGDYGIFAVILHTASDSMVLSFDSSAKPINKGRVRVFNEFTYQANADNGGVYIIDSKEDLIRFAKIASKFQEYTTYTSAKVAATIDMKGVEWTPIEGFDGAFDGGSKEGFEIQNLTAPLFGTTTATEIKNVKLTNVNIVENTRAVFGAVACEITNTDAVVKNCSVSGTIELATETVSEQYLYAAGLIGTSNSENEFSSLVNSANIKVSGKLGYASFLAGIVCRAEKGAISNSTNLGKIEFTSTSAYTTRFGGISTLCPVITNCTNGSKDDTTHEKGSFTVSGALTGHVYAGGLLSGFETASAATTFTNCNNYGNIVVDATSIVGSTQLGGIVGYNSNDARTVNIIRSHNYGGISVESEVKGSCRISGMVGNITGSTYHVEECSNNGKLYINAKVNDEVRLAGLVGALGGGGDLTIVNGYTNTGDIETGPKTFSAKNIQVGGIVANYSGTINSASTGCFKNTGNITYQESSDHNTVSRVSGCAAATNGDKLTFANAYWVNQGNITVTGNTKGHTIGVGGIYANSGRKINDAKCYCDITTTNCTAVGMIIAGAGSTAVENCHIGGSIKVNNNEKVTLTAENYYEYIYASGNTADLASTKKCGWLADINALPVVINNIVNIGSAEELLAFDFSSNKDIRLTDNIDLTGKSWTTVEGYEGSVDGNNKTITGLTAPLFGTVKSSIVDLRLEGVNINETVNANIGAFARKIDNTRAIFTNCSASGSITVNPATAPTANVFIAGLIGETTSIKEIYNVTNEVNIEVQGSYDKAAYCAGCISSASKSSIRKATNLGNITFKGTASTRAALSGISSNCLKLTDCTNGDDTAKNTKGNLTYDSTSNLTFYAGGMVQGINGVATYTDCANYGKISTTPTSKVAGVILGGLFGNNDDANARVYDNCCNYGDIDISAVSTSGNIKVGGIISQIGGDGIFTFLNNITNEGAVNVSVGIADAANSGKTTLVGGIAGALSSKGSYFSNDSNCTIKNTGAISYSANTSSAGYTKVAGLFAHNVPNHLDSENYKLINNGDITAEGAFGDEGFVGGIIGNERHVYNAKCHCNIVAVGYTYVGMIMGSSTSTFKAVNCLVGGSICTSTTGEGEAERLNTKTLDATNYFNYIYDDGYDLTTCTDNYYGCGYIESIDDDTPEYATQQPAE